MPCDKQKMQMKQMKWMEQTKPALNVLANLKNSSRGKFSQVIGMDGAICYIEDVNNLMQGNEDNPCAGRWKNMKDQHTVRMWSIFDETGIFIAVCRHGFSLVIADMVRSSERAKYLLAVVSRLLDAFGKGLGGGYDIGCKFKATLSRSSLAKSAWLLAHSSLVGSFHRHAHGRLCQLNHLATYVKGLGLEDLEGCEHTFLKSNALASTVHYSGIFHQRQAISNYFEHNNEYNVYANLSIFLHNNYKQAVNILGETQERLPQLKHELNITDDSVFHAWLTEERAYLLSQKKEPEEETAQMTYWQRLVNLAASRDRLAATESWLVITSTTATQELGHNTTSTTRLETARHHAQETYNKDLVAVQELEIKLDVTSRWKPGDVEWQNAGHLVAQRKYQHALDHLESLVVAHIFELSKMNQAGTGYKLHKHIGKVLQAWSSAIKTALEQYNIAAQALSPPHHTFTLEEVMEYTFLSNFQLLQDTCEDISQCPWASPTAHLALDMYFKMCHAQEEIIQLNVEIHRFVTYLQDEDQYLHACEEQLLTSHPVLAHQI
ncbi:hypothetical protein SCLCIDRAFT_27102 [Scleroderma citrinum Foug A]|uniref:Uncharacterized protein n=1 Tax=Scleroderma citrinum Foug A TaxID=1036808 RepID=A0A0C3DUT6_9AGAM|nr:hypothetical protein SCLCIDRAFT_27102 [Scleroderma citrinum Foug A]